jgi:chorismate dehydratase
MKYYQQHKSPPQAKQAVPQTTKVRFIKISFLCSAKINQLRKIKVGAVSYLNTKPLLYGIKRSNKVMQQIELIEEYPSKIATMLIDGVIDVGLVPVSIIPNLKEWHIVADYCIGSNGDVASVCLFSEVPLEKIEKVLLDYQSLTSVHLCKILLKHFWKISPVLENAKENYTKEISGTTAGVVIGDRALAQRKVSTYIYDLGEAWKTMTGKPFVFAAWIANKQLPDNFIQQFNEANSIGLYHIDEVVAANSNGVYDLNIYYKKNISYELTKEKLSGMEKFIELLKEY